MEGFARIRIRTDCTNHVGVDASIYYTVFDNDMETETVLSARTPQIYRLDASSLPPRIE